MTGEERKKNSEGCDYRFCLCLRLDVEGLSSDFESC